MKRNPYINYNEFADAIIDGDAKSLCDAIIYYHVGNYCRDCEYNYYDCRCESCDDCGWNYCMCDYGISKLYSFKTLVRKAAYKFVKQNFSKELIRHLIEIIKDHITPNDKQIQKAKTLKEIIDKLNYTNG